MDVGVPERVVVDIGVGLVLAVGPLRDLFAETPGRVVDHVVDGVFDRADAVTVDELAEPLRTELRRTDLRAQVADVARDAVVDLQRVQHVATLHAAVEHLHDRPTHAFAPDVGGGDVVAAGNTAAGVAVVALDARDQHHPAPARSGGVVGEHGCEDVVVGEVTAAVVRVVRDEHVAFVELLGTEELEREAHGQRGGEHELRDADRQCGQAAPRVEHGGVALVRLIEDRGRGGTGDVLGHLETDGLHSAPDHLGRHEIDGRRIRDAAPATGEPYQVDVRHRLPLA